MAARAKKAAPAPVDPEFDRRMMAAALRLGRRNLGRTGTNPAVGCIIVRTDGDARLVVGRGWTAESGRPHAEKEALAEAGKAAKGATAYVTLEPCAHEGRVKPCAQALADAGVARVVTAMEDPDPSTAGQGHALLEKAGIAVTTGVLAEAAARAHSGHIARIKKGRPHVTLKLAVSADGMIGKRVGERMIITGMPAFEAVQAMRTTFDVVMVGIGTVHDRRPEPDGAAAGARAADARPRHHRCDRAAAGRLAPGAVREGDAAGRGGRPDGVRREQGGTGRCRRRPGRGARERRQDRLPGGADGARRPRRMPASSPRAAPRSRSRWSPAT